MKLTWFPVAEEVKYLLHLATEQWENPGQSEAYIQQAIALSANDFNVLISAYRYFFYRNNPRMALRVAEILMEQVKAQEALPEDWEDLKVILRDRKEDETIRLYLNAYAAAGLLYAKLGDVEMGKEITARICDIDDQREFGAKTVFEVLTHPPEDDE